MPRKPSYRWPAYMPPQLREDLRVLLAQRGLSFSAWVRRHAEDDLHSIASAQMQGKLQLESTHDEARDLQDRG